MFTYLLLSASLMGLWGLQTGQVPGTQSGTKQPQDPQATTFQVKAAVHYVERGHHFNLAFKGSFTDPTDFDQGIQVTGTGDGLYRLETKDEVHLVPDVTVVTWLFARAEGVITQELPRGDRLVRTPAVPAVELLHVQPMSDGGVRALVASMAGRTVAEFEVSSSLVGALHPDKVAAVVAELFDLLDGGGPGTGPVKCSPTTSECYSMAVEGCANQGGLCNFAYSCNSQTGAASCSFTCCHAYPR